MSSKSKIHPTRLRIFEFIVCFHRQHGFSPTLREIASACYTGVSTVNYHLNILEDEGYITKEDKKARSIQIVQKPTDDESEVLCEE